MASSFSPSPSPSKRSPVKPNSNGSDLAQSLKHLSLASPANSPRAYKPAVDRSPSTPRPGSALRSPLNAPSTANGNRSRSSTPTLLRKASLNSLHSSNGVVPPRRASSVNLSTTMPRSPSTTMPRSPLRSISPPDIPERPVHTAESIASNFFKDELSLRHGAPSATGAENAPETMVVLHDSVYGHRYSRPRTSRAALSTIVERPERIKASVLGVSAAYVRLGERHAEGAHPLQPNLDAASIPTVPFRIHKTTRRVPLQSQTVTNVHGTKWMEELKIMCDAAESRLAMNGKELQRPDMKRDPDQETPKKFHEGDLYLCAESLDALEGALGGVCEAVDAVFNSDGPKRAFVAIRPPGHHCSASYPSGFCWINNVHVGIMHAILSHGLTHAAIIDFDLHHGDGSQSVAWQHNSRGVGLSKNAAWWKKTSIGYFSLHDINSYPCEMGDEEKVKNASLCIDNAHGQNVWNVHLQPWRSEAEFWKLYESKYSVLLDKTRTYLQTQTDRLRAAGQHSRAAIFLSAGFDASEWEGAGMQRHNVNVPTDFYARFTRDVVRIAAEEGTSVEGRIISVLEGGYSDRALYSGILSHLSGLAGDDPAVKDQDFNGLGYEMGQRIGSAGGQRAGSSGQIRGRKDSSASERGTRPYEPSWWSLPELEVMEATVAPVPVEEPKKPRNQTPPTYSSPTAASSAKVLPSLKVRRSISGLSAMRNATPSRPPTPPPPEVPWAVAAHELSKLLIPADRQTGSCTHEDLAAEATRARQARQSALSQTTGSAGTSTASTPEPRAAPVRMALRERKAKPSLPLEAEGDGKNRRKTVAGPVLAADKAAQKMKAPSRRLSAASTVVVSDVASGVSTRPETSASIRPESSMSARTTPLAVKKTRAVPAVKKEPVPRQPRTQKKPAAELSSKQPLRPATSRTTSATTSGVSSGQSGDDMDRLTGDMKKIKITVITQAQREARERERRERELKAQAENQAPPFSHTVSDTPVIQLGDPVIEKERSVVVSPSIPSFDDLSDNSPSAGAAGQTEQTTSRAAPTPSVPSAPFAPVTPSKDEIAFTTPSFPARTPLPPSSPTMQSPAPANDMFIQYQPEGPTPPVVQQQQKSLQWLPPNSATPAPTPARRELPVFTSTSAIPFAPRPGSATPLLKKEAPADQSVWEVPETPQH
ncbi:Arginase/deacetylase [Coniochaeta ligniaria NRRL 30616]|uniref:Arginase/deacetylase n=1 Tax=Coniochaeta ligniaria NRRL 30616 TaxID=1408157 RepID=A0A1J7JLC6_9PEZI|nr:Arginase/deacetylase [Coniochaeta ligniaria NRRL 30616]